MGNSHIESKNAMRDSLVSSAEIYSYAPDASSPIIFEHYKYTHQVAEKVNITAPAKGYLIYIFLSGKFFYILDSSILHPSYGDIALLSDGVVFTHGVYTVSELDYYQIEFSKEFFEKTKKNNIFSSLFFENGNGKNRMVSLDSETIKRIISRFEKLEDHIKSDGYDELFAYSYVIQILYIIFSNIGANQRRDTNLKIPQTLSNAVSYIQENYKTLSNVNDVAAHCCISTTYLGMIFKKYMLTTPTQYITFLRISHAKYMLMQGANVTEACFESGFNNYSYFINTFKKIIGKTPLKFKKDSEVYSE